jgi:hypothetical protein
VIAGLRGVRARLREDERGIALLLAIAGAVAAVLITRAGTETDRLEGETDRWSALPTRLAVR